MSTPGTDADAVRFYLTGASRDKGDQVDPDLALGGFASCTPAESLGHRPVLAIRGMRIIDIAGQNGIGEGRLAAVSASELTWTPPGGTTGSKTTILAGETQVIPGNDTDKYITVRRSLTSGALAGVETVEISDIVHNSIAIDEVTSAEAAAGDINYHGLMARAAEAITGLIAWTRPLRTAGVVADTAQLGASGAGTIEGPAGSFKGWPNTGGVYIEDSGLTISEVAYYSSRTDDVLTVPAAGRALLGTSATAGAATDIAFSTALVRLGKETPSSSAIQTIANDGTEPTSPAVTWVANIRSADAVSIGALAVDGLYGLWIERNITVGHIADHWAEVRFGYQFTDAGGTLREGTLSGRYRVANDGLVRWEVFRTTGATPFDFTATPHDTFTSSPHLLDFVLSNSTKYSFITLPRNKYGLLTPGLIESVIETDSGGLLVPTRPSGPDEVMVADAAGGDINIQALYSPGADATPADTWAIWYETDGTTPDPDVDAVKVEVSMDSVEGLEWLNYDTSGLGVVDNTPVEVVVRTRIAGSPDIDSENTAAVTFSTDTAGPTKPRGFAFFDAFGMSPNSPATAPTTDFDIDVGNNIRIEIGRGFALFYGDTELIWGVFFNSQCPDDSIWYIPSDWNFVNATVSGAGGTDAIETASWTGGDKRLYVVVNGTRRMEIDVTNKTITADTFILWGATSVTAGADAVWQRFTEILFMVWDSYIEDNVSFLSMDSAGVMTSRVPVNQLLTQAQIEAL